MKLLVCLVRGHVPAWGYRSTLRHYTYRVVCKRCGRAYEEKTQL